MTRRDAEAEAHAALRRLQGAGARYDAATAPAGDLLLARRASAAFARQLNEMRDGDLDLPSRQTGWQRRQVIAEIGLQARALANLLGQLRGGGGHELVPPSTAKIALGATLPAHALRHLFQHSQVHLDVEWRDLPEACWDAPIRIGAQAGLRVYDTPLLRAGALWQAALDLDAGVRAAEVPPRVAQLSQMRIKRN